MLSSGNGGGFEETGSRERIAMATIAVLGATGKYGGKAIEYLLARGVEPSDIIAVYRSEEAAEPLRSKGIITRRGDYSTPDFGPEIFEGAEKLLFVSGNDSDSLNRIRHHLTVVEAARQAGVGQVVYTGVAYPETCPFGMENVHVATECAIKAAGLPFTFLRNTFYIELFLNEPELRRAIDSGRLLTLTEGRKLNFVSRDDMAKAAAVVLTHEGHENKTYEITAAQPYTYRDIAAILTDVSGKTVEYVEATGEQLAAYLAEWGTGDYATPMDSSLFQADLARGWAEPTDPSLADLIAPDRIMTPRDIIERVLG